MKQKGFLRTNLKQYQLILMVLPAFIWLVVFQFYPLWGWYMAFTDFRLGRTFSELNFVGLQHFRNLLIDNPRFYASLRNTVIMSSLAIVVTGFVMPITFAIMLNEIKLIRFKKVVQTVSYLPHFVSWVVVAGLVSQMLSPTGGVINQVLVGLRIINQPINFLAHEQYFYAILTIAGLWKSMGWNSIIYIAAITSIDQEMYEAADVDGASRLRKIWHITLPHLTPTIIILFIMGISGIVGAVSHEAAFLLRNPMTFERAEVLTLYALRFGIQMMRFSYGTAVGIFTSVIAVIMVFTVNGIFRKFTDYSLF